MASKDTSVTTKAEAIRQAFRALGFDARASDVHAYIKKQFGFEISESNVYQVRNKLKEQGEGVGETTTPPQTPPVPAPSEGETFTLRDIEAVRAAGKRVGWGALKRLVQSLSD